MRFFKTIILAVSLAAALPLAGQEDRYTKLESLLDEFVQTMQAQSLDEKAAECDRMITACVDSTTKHKVARGLFERYRDSELMGDEAVAIGIYDKWFADGPLTFGTEFETLNAGLFADVNRSTLLGVKAPRIIMENPDGKRVRFPRAGRTTVVFFYNVDCAKCKAVEAALPSVLNDAGFGIDIVAVYVGDKSREWESFRKSRFTGYTNKKLFMFHLWDPEGKTEFERLWGVISTPKLYLVDAEGTVIGRRLEPEALLQLLPLAEKIQNEYEKQQKAMKADEFKVVSDTTVDGVRHITATPSSLVCSKQIDFDIKNGRVYNVVYKGGCPGNLIAVERLIEGKKVSEIVGLLDGIDCAGRGTSCTDQLARILKSLQ